MKAVLFDLDGTLLDTLRDIVDSCNAALVRHGYPCHPAAAYKLFIGDGVGNLISRALPESERDPSTISLVVSTYRDEYQKRWNATTRVYDGVPELLDELTRRSVPMAVLSNKPHDFTRRCVDEFLARWKFSSVLGASNDFPPKPDPAAALHIAKELGIPPCDFAYLGDTSTDMRTAISAGMRAVGVLWGFRSESELRESGAELIISHPQELIEVFADGTVTSRGDCNRGGVS